MMFNFFGGGRRSGRERERCQGKADGGRGAGREKEACWVSGKRRREKVPRAGFSCHISKVSSVSPSLSLPLSTTKGTHPHPHHIQRRVFRHWVATRAKPPLSVDKITPGNRNSNSDSNNKLRVSHLRLCAGSVEMIRTLSLALDICSRDERKEMRGEDGSGSRSDGIGTRATK